MDRKKERKENQMDRIKETKTKNKPRQTITEVDKQAPSQ